MLRLQADKDFVFEILKSGDSLAEYLQAAIVLQFAPAELKNNFEIVLECVKRFPGMLQFASENLRDNKTIVLEAVKKDGMVWVDLLLSSPSTVEKHPNLTRSDLVRLYSESGAVLSVALYLQLVRL